MVVDLLSRPSCDHKDEQDVCEICEVVIAIPSRSAESKQLKDSDIAKDRRTVEL